eukprot:gene10275-biopygen6275
MPGVNSWEFDPPGYTSRRARRRGAGSTPTPSVGRRRRRSTLRRQSRSGAAPARARRGQRGGSWRRGGGIAPRRRCWARRCGCARSRTRRGSRAGRPAPHPCPSRREMYLNSLKSGSAEPATPAGAVKPGWPNDPARGRPQGRAGPGPAGEQARPPSPLCVCSARSARWAESLDFEQLQGFSSLRALYQGPGAGRQHSEKYSLLRIHRCLLLAPRLFSSLGHGFTGFWVGTGRSIRKTVHGGVSGGPCTHPPTLGVGTVRCHKKKTPGNRKRCRIKTLRPKLENRGVGKNTSPGMGSKRCRKKTPVLRKCFCS